MNRAIITISRRELSVLEGSFFCRKISEKIKIARKAHFIILENVVNLYSKYMLFLIKV